MSGSPDAGTVQPRARPEAPSAACVTRYRRPVRAGGALTPIERASGERSSRCSTQDQKLSKAMSAVPVEGQKGKRGEL